MGYQFLFRTGFFYGISCLFLIGCSDPEPVEPFMDVLADAGDKNGGKEGAESDTDTSDYGDTQHGDTESESEEVDAVSAAPIALFDATPSFDQTVNFDASKSTDPNGTIVSYRWTFSDGSTASGPTVIHRFESIGCHEAELRITDDEGLSDVHTRAFRVVSNAVPSVVPDLALTGLPKDTAVIPRDLSTNLGTVTLQGTVPSVEYHSLLATVLQDDTVVAEVRTALCGNTFALEVPIVAELASNDIVVSLESIEGSTEVARAQDVVAGDFLLVTGQSNAFSAVNPASPEALADFGGFVRSFGIRPPFQQPFVDDQKWYPASAWGYYREGPGAVGLWSLRMAFQLSERVGIPIALINHADPGKPITFFQRNDANPRDLNTNYGQMLYRTTCALGATCPGGPPVLEAPAVRAILYYQGEADGAYVARHKSGFVSLHEDWRENYPNVERFYVTQIRSGCTNVMVEMREVQRRFAFDLPNTTVMSTTGLNGHDGCHFYYEQGYKELGDRYARLLARDLYGVSNVTDVEAVDVSTVSLSGNQIFIDTDSDASSLIVDQGIEKYFQLTGGGSVTGVRAEGSRLVLDITPGSRPSAVAFVGHSGSGPWITNSAGVGLLAFQLPVPPQ